MLLTPLYDRPSFFQVDVPLGDPAVPVLRRRERLASRLGELDDAQWATASRCEGWSVRDVISHLVTTNEFWAFSIGAGLAGKPTRFLTTFDPVASPAELVDGTRSQPTAEVLDRFVTTNAALADAITGLDDDSWSALAEAPPGHVPLRALVAHALWDSWVHERDIVLPLGLTPVEEPDEIALSLAYAAGLSPALSRSTGSTRPGAIAVDTSDPDIHLVVDVGDSIRVHTGPAPADAFHLTGPAVDLLEALSYRAPLPCPVPESHRWLLSGLAEAFDQG